MRLNVCSVRVGSVKKDHSNLKPDQNHSNLIRLLDAKSFCSSVALNTVHPTTPNEFALHVAKKCPCF